MWYDITGEDGGGMLIPGDFGFTHTSSGLDKNFSALSGRHEHCNRLCLIFVLLSDGASV